MLDSDNPITSPAKRVPWNKGKLTGAKPPLRPKHVWAIRTMLQNTRQVRDLALFNLAIDSKLRGCDVVAVKVDDGNDRGYRLVVVEILRREGVLSDAEAMSVRARHAPDIQKNLAGAPVGRFEVTF